MSIITKGKLYKEDMALTIGSELTGTRKTSTGGLQTLTKIDWVGVDVYATQGSKTSSAVAAAISMIGSEKRQIYLCPGDWTLSANLTIPSNIHLLVADGALIDGAFTLTINGRCTLSGDSIGALLTVVYGTATALQVSSLSVNGGARINGTLTIHNPTTTSPALIDTTAEIDRLTVKAGGDALDKSSGLIRLFAADHATTPGIVIIRGTNGTTSVTGITVESTGTVDLPVGLEIGGVALTATPAEINSRCDGVPSTVNENNTELTTVTSGETTEYADIDLGTVSIGDTILLFAQAAATARPDGDCIFKIWMAKKSGTSTVTFFGSNIYPAAADIVPSSAAPFHLNISACLVVTVAGTLVVKLDGVLTGPGTPLRVSDMSLQGVFIKKA